ncbi:hypothetical protein FA13DRAFT_1711955 [Coprinellus micaceus]|uniref:Uncharacterized protein n=1 Tax=Coprinellus micaceus TaxID=71717 RepID=A0A4Y7T1U0_COPMI|nr:hypothetical protein FA13DRAFT_1711955 [Coprinellus micaceus]
MDDTSPTSTSPPTAPLLAPPPAAPPEDGMDIDAVDTEPMQPPMPPGPSAPVLGKRPPEARPDTEVEGRKGGPKRKEAPKKTIKRGPQKDIPERSDPDPRVPSGTFTYRQANARAKPTRKSARKRRRGETPEKTPPAPFIIDLPAKLQFPEPAVPPPPPPIASQPTTSTGTIMRGLLSMSGWNRVLNRPPATSETPPPPVTSEPPQRAPAWRPAFNFDITSFGLKPRRPSLPPPGPSPDNPDPLSSPPRPAHLPIHSTPNRSPSPSQSQAPQTQSLPVSGDPATPPMLPPTYPHPPSPEQPSASDPVQVSSSPQHPIPAQNPEPLQRSRPPSPRLDPTTPPSQSHIHVSQIQSTPPAEDTPASPMEDETSPGYLPNAEDSEPASTPLQKSSSPQRPIPVQNLESPPRSRPSSPRPDHAAHSSPPHIDASQILSTPPAGDAPVSPMEDETSPGHPLPNAEDSEPASTPRQGPSPPQHPIPIQNFESPPQSRSSIPHPDHTTPPSPSHIHVSQTQSNPPEDTPASPMDDETFSPGHPRPPMEDSESASTPHQDLSPRPSSPARQSASLGKSQITSGSLGLSGASWGTMRDTMRNLIGGGRGAPASAPAPYAGSLPNQRAPSLASRGSPTNPPSHTSSQASPEAQLASPPLPAIPPPRFTSVPRVPSDHLRFATPLKVPSMKALHSPILPMPSPLTANSLASRLTPFEIPTALNTGSGVPDSNALGLYGPVYAQMQPPASSTASDMRVDPPRLARSFSEPPNLQPPVFRRPLQSKKKTSSATRQSLPRGVKSRAASAALSAKASGKQRATNQDAGKGRHRGKGKAKNLWLSTVTEDDEWENENSDQSMYEPTDEEIEGEGDESSDGGESDGEDYVRRALLGGGGEKPPSSSNQPLTDRQSFVTTHPDMTLDDLRPLDQPENDSDLPFNPVKPPQPVHRSSYRAPSPAPLMADHYASPDAQDRDDISNTSDDLTAFTEVLAEKLATKFGSFQQDILSTVRRHHTTTQDFIRNNTMQPDAVRAIIAEEVGKVGARPSKRGRQTTTRKSKKCLPPELENDPTLPYFREHVHNYVRVTLLKIEVDEGDAEAMDTDDGLVNIRTDGIGAALLKFKPLSEEEYSKWHQRLPDAFKLSTTNFRFEFTRSMADRFNKEASYVAVTGLLTAFDDGRYSRQLRNGQQLNPGFLQRENAILVVETYAIHLARMYKEASETTAEDDKRTARLKKSNQTTRRWNLFQERLDTCLAFLPLHVLIPLLKTIGTDGMSDDESEDEMQGDAVVSTRYFKRRPEWRGFELEHQLYTVDSFTPSRKRSTIGRRTRKPGNARRIREESDRTYKTTFVPKGLHKNLYSAAFLATLQPWETANLGPLPHRYPHKIPSFAEYAAEMRGQGNATNGAPAATPSAPRVAHQAQQVASGSNVRLDN